MNYVLILIGVFFGGGLGSVLRYVVSDLLEKKGSFPLATFVVNIAGCLIIGLFFSISIHQNTHPFIKSVLIAGFCGGLTTFSTFSKEIFMLFSDGQFTTALFYSAISLICGFAAVAFGFYIASKLLYA